MKLATVVVGGAVGLALGAMILSFGLGIDIFSGSNPHDDLVANSSAQGHATVSRKTEAQSQEGKSLDSAKPIVPKPHSESDEQRVTRPPAERSTAMNDESGAPLAYPVWVTLRPTTLEASRGTKLSTLYDSSVLASGFSAETNTYVLTATSPLTEITGFQIEALPDSSLPERGPGRAGGNFVLTEFKVFVIGSDGEAVPIALHNASASYEQDHLGSVFSAAKAIDGDVNRKYYGWSLVPGLGKPHRMVVETVEPIRGSEIKLRIILDQQHGKQHTLGRFRLAVTSSLAPLTAEGPAVLQTTFDYGTK